MTALKAYRNATNLTGQIFEVVPPAGVALYSVWNDRAQLRLDDVPVASGTASIKFFYDDTFAGSVWSDSDVERGDVLRFWADDLEPEAFNFTVPATGGSGSEVGGGTTLPDLIPSPAGTVGDATHVAQVTVNAKGLVTAASAVPIAGGTGGGTTGNSAYQDWLTLPGNAGKTLAQFIASLVSTVPGPASTVAGPQGDDAFVAWQKAGNLTGTMAQFLASIAALVPAGTGGGTTLPDLSPSPAGAVGDATHVAAITVNAKGLVTGRSSVAIAFPPPSAGGGGIAEAPADGQLYARKNAAWSAFSIGSGGVVYNFPQSLLDAFNNSTALNWLGGDVTLTAPLDLLANSNKIGFSLNGNRARITSAFNNAGAHAIKFRIVNGGVSIREFAIENLTFSGSSAFAGGVTFECLRNDSWIYSFAMNNIVTSGHSGHGVWCRGSVFEAQFDTMGSTNGLGVFRATTEGPAGNVGLPSALVGRNWRPRDFNGNAVQLDSPVAYTEPFDLRLWDGYFVTGLGPGYGISAPSGITMVNGSGFENIQNSAIYDGYRGGRFINCQGANAGGMPNLVHAQLANGSLALDGCSVENENAGSGVKLALIDDLGGGRCMLNPTRSDQNGNDIAGNLPKASYSIVSYRPKT